MRSRSRLVGLLAAIVFLTAPGLTWAAAACLPACCAGEMSRASADETDACGSLALRVCCAEAPSIAAPPASPGSVEPLAFDLSLPPLSLTASGSRRLRPASALLEARLAPRTSPLRLSVVLLI